MSESASAAPESAAPESAAPDPESAAVLNRRSWTTLAAFIFGLPAGLGILALCHGPWRETPIVRYVSHPVEWVEVVLFCCALAALLAKAAAQWRERVACRHELVPFWRGEAAAVSDAAPLLAGLHGLGAGLADTWIARRMAAVLDFVARRGSAQHLDDHMRALADNDALAVESSYALIRFITWAIPILGFLGTVLGITAAIAGVTPEVLEKSLSTVTDGLALAFDTTALALGLVMILMFVNYLVERLEQGTLARVDRIAQAELAHRFERVGPASGEFVLALRHNTGVLVKTMEQLVERQTSLWAATVDQADRHWREGGQRAQQQLAAALETAMQKTLAVHAQCLLEVEKQNADRGRDLLASMNTLAERLADQLETLSRVQEGEAQLIRLQETLQQNLSALAGAGSFEQAVQSLTAAIHLLTARQGATIPGRLQTAA